MCFTLCGQKLRQWWKGGERNVVSNRLGGWQKWLINATRQVEREKGAAALWVRFYLSLTRIALRKSVCELRAVCFGSAD